mgnify:CR=1 FL=1
MEPKARKRLQIDASPELIEEIEKLSKSLDTTTNAETVRRAFRIALWMVRERAAGNDIVSIDKDGNTTRLVLLF